MIKLKLKENYHHYILNSKVELNDVSTFIEKPSHFFLCMASSLRSNHYVVISEEDDLDVDHKLMRANPIVIEEKYLSLNISLKNRIKSLPIHSDLTSLVNLASYFKTHL